MTSRSGSSWVSLEYPMSIYISEYVYEPLRDLSFGNALAGGAVKRETAWWYWHIYVYSKNEHCALIFFSVS